MASREKENSLFVRIFDKIVVNHVSTIEVILRVFGKLVTTAFNLFLVWAVFCKYLSPVAGILYGFTVYLCMYKIIDIIVNTLTEYNELGLEIEELDKAIAEEKTMI